MESTARLEYRVGMLVLAGMAATVFLILASDKVSFEGSYRVTAYLQDAAGLRPGSPVELAGIPIGRVMAVQTTADRRGPIQAYLEIDNSYRLSQASTLTLATSGIFGDSFLSFSATIDEGAGTLPVDGSAEVEAEPAFLAKATAQLGDIADGISELLDADTRTHVKHMVAQGDALVGEILLTVRALRQQTAGLDALLADAHDLVRETRDSQRVLSGQVGTGLDEAIATLREVRTRSAAIGERFARLGAAGTALIDDSRGLIATTHGLVGGLEDDRDHLVADLRALGAGLRLLLGDLRDGRGVLGQLLANDALAGDLNRTMINLDDLSERLSTHPEILIFGDSAEARAAARAARERRKVRRAFMEGYEYRPPDASGNEAPASDRTGEE